MSKNNSAKKGKFLGDGSVVATNRKARFEFELTDKIEAGVALVGCEVKSIRQGKASLVDSFARVKDGQAWLTNMYVGPYEQGIAYGFADPRRERKLLLHKREIARLAGKLANPGMSLIPLKLYFKNGRVKVELALARGKKAHDKRQSIRDREEKRDMDRLRKQHGTV